MVTETQVSSGGVCVRTGERGAEVALVCVGAKRRWQLPKGIVEAGESPEVAALREVREEAGVEATLVEPLETIEYWYQVMRGGTRVRYHKYVHFFLLTYERGDVADHDHEVQEARWVPIDEAANMLAFANERRVVARAAAIVADGKKK